MSRVQGVKAVTGLCRAYQGTAAQSHGIGAAAMQQMRGGSSVPEYWGRDSPYHPGTEFLGTPKNHLDLVAERPLSPHVFDLKGTSFHYKMPPGAVSSIANRASGFMLSMGTGAVGVLALTGDLPAAVAALQGSALLMPAKAVVAFPLVYHYVAGLRHFYWDRYRYPMMATLTTPLEVPAVAASSKTIMGASAAVAAVLAVISF